MRATTRTFATATMLLCASTFAPLAWGVVVDGSRVVDPAVEILADGRTAVLHGRPVLQVAVGAGAPWSIEPALGTCADAHELTASPSGVLLACATRDGLVHVGLDEGAGWSFEPLDGGHSAEGPCVAGWAGDGRPVVAWSDQSGLRVARRDAGEWSIESAVDTTGAPIEASDLSFAVDPAGRPALSFTRRADATVFFAREQADGWAVNAVEEGVDCRCTSLAFSPDGRAAIAYRDDVSDEDRLAIGAPRAWSIEVVRERNGTACSRTLEFLPDGRAVIAALDALLVRDASGWTIETFPDDLVGGAPDRMAVDPAGRVVVASPTTVGFREAPRDWRLEPVTAGPRRLGIRPGFAIADDGAVHLAYAMHLDDGLTTVATRSPGGTWDLRSVNIGGVSTTHHLHALALDGEGRPAVVVANADAGILLARFDGSGWATEAVPSEGGRRPSLAFDAGGRPAIAHVEQAARLRVARRETDGWVTDTVGLVDDETEPILARDRYGHLVLVYAARGELRVARRGRDAWVSRVVDPSEGERHLTPSIAFTTGGRLAVSYHVEPSNETRLAIEEREGWSVETLDLPRSLRPVARSFTFDPDGRLFFALEATWVDPPLLVWREWGEWLTLSVEAGIESRWPPWIARAPDGDLVVAYADDCSEDLRVIDWTPPERQFLLVRKSVDDLSTGWRDAIFPLAGTNDDEAGDFPVTSRPVRVLDEIPSGPLVLYRALTSDGMLPPTLRVKKVAGVPVVTYF